jgi:hypothetical protein
MNAKAPRFLRAGVWIGAGILLAAAGLRLASAQSGGLWLDEIWSLQLARDLSSPLAVLGVRQDNNHPLNTLLLRALLDERGPADFLVFRLPALLAGIATVWISGLLARQRGGREALVTMGLVACSSLMVHYSSEARGYALAMLFASTAVLAAGQPARNGWACLAFNASVVLGMLSHFSFIHAYGAVLCWWLWQKRSAARRETLLELLRWHALPILCVVVLYWVYARALPVAGGPEPHWGRLLARTGALTVGLPGSGVWRWIGGSLAMGLAVLGIGRLARRGDDRWVLYAAGIFAVPLGILAIHQPGFVAPRYFLMSVLLLLWLLAAQAGELLRGGKAARVAAVVLLTIFALGNLRETRASLQHGRGQYWRALTFMANHSAGPVLHLGSDHDIRVGIVVGYYADLLPAGKQLAYYRHDQWPENGPEWLVRHRHGRLYPIEPEFVGRAGNRYRLERVFPTGPLSGAHWIVYRNAGQGPT